MDFRTWKYLYEKIMYVFSIPYRKAAHDVWNEARNWSQKKKKRRQFYNGGESWMETNLIKNIVHIFSSVK